MCMKTIECRVKESGRQGPARLVSLVKLTAAAGPYMCQDDSLAMLPAAALLGNDGME